MKHYITNTLMGIIVAVVAVFGLSNVALAEDKFVNQADIDVINGVMSKLDDFTNDLSNSSVSIESISTKVVSTQQAIKVGVDHSYSTDLGDAYTKEASKLKGELSKMSDTVGKAPKALASNNQTTVQAYFNEYNEQLTAINAQVSAVNDAVEEGNNSTGNLYLYLLIATVVIAVVAFLWAFVRPDINAAAAEAQKRVAYASIAPIIGAGITYFTYQSSTDGSYTILYGPIIFGFLIMVGAIVSYAKTRGKIDQPPASTTASKK